MKDFFKRIFLSGLTGRAFLIQFLVILTGILSLPYISGAQQVHTYVDVDSVRVGDTINLSVLLEGNYTLLEYPREDAFSDDLELQQVQRFQSSAGGDSLAYTLQYFGVEDLVIDPLEFSISAAGRDTTLRSSRIPLYFKSTLASEEEDLRPLKPIFDFARSVWPFLLGGLLLIGIGYLVYRYLKERAKQETFIPESYAEEAFVNPLDQLEEDIMSLQSGTAPATREEFERFYVRLADAIRLYLKRVYGFAALEMTTREILAELRHERASAQLIKDVKIVLNDADMVKFAKFNPASDQVSNAIQTGVDFLETARSVDADRVEYLEFQHKEEQNALREKHDEEQQQLKEAFEQ